MKKIERAKAMTLDKWYCILFMMLADIDISVVLFLGRDSRNCGFCVEYKIWDGSIGCRRDGCPLPKTGVCGVTGSIYADALICYEDDDKKGAIKLVEKLLNIVEGL